MMVSFKRVRFLGEAATRGTMEFAKVFGKGDLIFLGSLVVVIVGLSVIGTILEKKGIVPLACAVPSISPPKKKTSKPDKIEKTGVFLGDDLDIDPPSYRDDLALHDSLVDPDGGLMS
jgi:hypothetical protein